MIYLGLMSLKLKKPKFNTQGGVPQKLDWADRIKVDLLRKLQTVVKKPKHHLSYWTGDVAGC